MNKYYHCKFTVLLAALLLMMAVRLVTLAEGIPAISLDALGALFLVAAILAICDHRRFRSMALFLGIPAFTATLGGQLGGTAGHVSLIAARGFSTVFIAFTILVILRDLLTQRKVTWDSIVGTFCGYLLIGIMWSELFALLELLSPTALHLANGNAPNPTEPVLNWHRLQYFSFVTLSTVGYGDITPISPTARFLAALEAICGQFYLAVLVAGLVGVKVSNQSNGDPERTADS
jgi:hypothetical protein